jgi:hypothetical protein
MILFVLQSLACERESVCDGNKKQKKERGNHALPLRGINACLNNTLTLTLSLSLPHSVCFE